MAMITVEQSLAKGVNVGDVGPIVVDIRNRVDRAGFPATWSPNDPSTYDIELAQRVANFQTTKGLPPTGIVDADTWVALGGTIRNAPLPGQGGAVDASAGEAPSWLSKVAIGLGVAVAALYITAPKDRKFSFKGVFKDFLSSKTYGMLGESYDEQEDEDPEEDPAEPGSKAAVEAALKREVERRMRANPRRSEADIRNEIKQEGLLAADRARRGGVKQPVSAGRGLPGTVRAKPAGAERMHWKNRLVPESQDVRYRDDRVPVVGTPEDVVRPLVFYVDPDRWSSDTAYQNETKGVAEARAVAAGVPVEIRVDPVHADEWLKRIPAPAKGGPPPTTLLWWRSRPKKERARKAPPSDPEIKQLGPGAVRRRRNNKLSDLGSPLTDQLIDRAAQLAIDGNCKAAVKTLYKVKPASVITPRDSEMWQRVNQIVRKHCPKSKLRYETEHEAPAFLKRGATATPEDITSARLKVSQDYTHRDRDRMPGHRTGVRSMRPEDIEMARERQEDRLRVLQAERLFAPRLAIDDEGRATVDDSEEPAVNIELPLAIDPETREVVPIDQLLEPGESTRVEVLDNRGVPVVLDVRKTDAGNRAEDEALRDRKAFLRALRKGKKAKTQGQQRDPDRTGRTVYYRRADGKVVAQTWKESKRAKSGREKTSVVVPEDKVPPQLRRALAPGGGVPPDVIVKPRGGGGPVGAWME